MSAVIQGEILDTLKHKVHIAARDGRAISIFAMLWNLDRDTVVNETLSHLTDDKNGQRTTPLIIAARNGREKVVQVLLSNLNANVELTGTVKFDGYSIEGVTALWCAAGAGHYGIVKMLIEHGAEVNHSTNTNSTPLRAACFDGRLDIVKYLVDNNADISIANKYKNTCLMISCYKGHKDVVRYLLEKGTQPDSRAHCGATALHFSAECGHLDIVSTLTRYGATMLKNDNGMTPLMVAAENGQSEIVDFLTSLPDCVRLSKINAFELLGASFANDKENYCIHKAYTYLHKGMTERFEYPDSILHKTPCQPVHAYDNRVESKTLEELEAIKDDHYVLHMEALAIRERILGSENTEVPHPVIYRGAVFADNSRFDRCIALWLHALTLRQNNKRTISKDLLRFAQVFSQMVHLGNPLEFTPVREVFEHAILELQFDQNRIEKDVDENEPQQEVYAENIHTCIYLLVIMLKVKNSPKETEELHKSVYRFLQQKPMLRNLYTPLHMATDFATIVDDFHVNDVVTFPNGKLTELLIDCGANVNARDNCGNTPLHIIVRYTQPISDFETLHQSIMALIQNGAHLDICNLKGKIPIEEATTGVAEVIIRTNQRISLKCLAAKVIMYYSIPYKDNVPKVLEEFVELH